MNSRDVIDMDVWRRKRSLQRQPHTRINWRQVLILVATLAVICGLTGLAIGLVLGWVE